MLQAEKVGNNGARISRLRRARNVPSKKGLVMLIRQGDGNVHATIGKQPS